jgi:hypothetical protein
MAYFSKNHPQLLFIGVADLRGLKQERESIKCSSTVPARHKKGAKTH